MINVLCFYFPHPRFRFHSWISLKEEKENVSTDALHYIDNVTGLGQNLKKNYRANIFSAL